MATTPDNEEPGFETDVNELLEDQDNGSEDTRRRPLPEDGGENIEESQEEAAEERKEGGYQ